MWGEGVGMERHECHVTRVGSNDVSERERTTSLELATWVGRAVDADAILTGETVFAHLRAADEQ